MPSLHSQNNRVVPLLIFFSVCVILLISTLTSNGAFNMTYAKPSDRKGPAGSSRDGDDRSSKSGSSNKLRNETGNESPPTKPPLVPEPPANGGTATLKIRKVIDNTGGGTKRPSDFTINVDGNNPSPKSFPGSSSGTTVELSRGRYSVSETGPSGYTSNPSSGCSGSINPDQERSCTITNVYNAPPVTTGKIIVTKQVDNTGGGTKRPSDFTINVDGNNPSPKSFPGSSAGSTVKIQPGRYQISETGPISSDYVPGRYTPSYSADCSGNIRATETNNCIIVNKYNPVIPGILSKLVVTKKVINDGGGTKRPSDFTITVHGNNPSPSSFYGRSSGTNVELRLGKYSVTETGPTSRYSTDYSRDCSGNANPNSVRKCTITNVYQEPGPTSKLIVIKNVDNNNKQGSLNRKPSDFTITVQGNNPSPRSFAGRSDSGVSVSIYPGSYRVTERSQSGYTVDYSNDCNGNIKSGQTKVCIITNEGTSQSLPVVITQPILTNISGFFAPYGLTTDTSNGNVYVTNFGRFNTTGSVSVINSSTNTIMRSLTVGNNPQAIEYNSANGLVYAANLLSDTLSIINGTSNQVVNTIPVGKSPGNSPSGIGINTINNTIYAVNTGANTISVINGTNNQVKGYLKGFFNPSAVTFNSDNDAIYITNKGTNSISIMNATNFALIKTLSSGGIMPSALVYNSANGLVYISNTGSNTVSVLNTTTNTITGTIPVGAAPIGIAYNQENAKVYVANSVSGTISVINSTSNTVTNTIPVGKTPMGVSYNPINNSIYVANLDSNTVTMIKEAGLN